MHFSRRTRGVERGVGRWIGGVRGAFLQIRHIILRSYIEMRLSLTRASRKQRCALRLLFDWVQVDC